MNINPSISQRKIKNRRRDGTRIQYSRYVVEFRDPRTGRRKAKKFERRQDAVAYRNELIAQVSEDSYIDPREAPTVAKAA
jgi:integrase